MLNTLFDTVAVLFVIAAVFGYINNKVFKLPFAIGMMFAGLIASSCIVVAEWIYPMAILGTVRSMFITDVNFTDALMHGMLSFLLFAGAMHTDLSKLRKWAVTIGMLTTVGVIISAAIIGVVSYFLFLGLDVPVPFAYCLVFGALITPTDPVAVLGIMHASGAPRDIESKVVGESLFNDGVGVVLFTVLATIATAGGAASGEHVTSGHVLELILLEVGGGIGLGLLGGYIAYLAMRTLQEPSLETLISIALVMGLTVVAFGVHSSAPLACVVAGLFIGNHGWEVAMDAPTRLALGTVWHFIDDALNAILFLLIGLEALAIKFESAFWAAALGIILLCLFARFVAVYLPIALLNLKVDFLPGTKPILWWGGIKGGISVALALSLPNFQGREVIIAVTYATVVVSVLTQGLTIGKVVKKVVPKELLADRHGDHSHAAGLAD